MEKMRKIKKLKSEKKALIKINIIRRDNACNWTKSSRQVIDCSQEDCSPALLAYTADVQQMYSTIQYNTVE